MIDATPCVVIDFLLAHGKQIAESELEDAWQHGFDEGYGQGWQFAQKAGPSEAQGAGHSQQQGRHQCKFFRQGTCRNGDACRPPGNTPHQFRVPVRGCQKYRCSAG